MKIPAEAGIFCKSSFEELANGTKGFQVENAFLKFTATAGANIVLTATADIFSTGKEFTLTATGEEQYVAINPTKENETTNFSYSINDVKCKEKTQVTFKPKAIYAIEFEVPVAKVGEQGYFDINDAIAAANGATVTLLANGTVSQACQINKNGHTLTVNGNFVALKNYKNANGYYDVVAATKHAEFKVRGDFNNWGWDDAKDLYIITGTNLWVAPEVELTANQTFKFANESWSNNWGAINTTAVAANTWQVVGGTTNNIKVQTAGTYNVIYDSVKGVYCIANTQYTVPCAKVSNKVYTDLNAALTAAGTATVVVLFENATVSKACRIDKNGCTLTVTGNFLPLKNYENNNGYIDVKAITAPNTWRLAGKFNGKDCWTIANGGQYMKQITGTNTYVVHNVSLKTNDMFKFFKGSNLYNEWVGSWTGNNGDDATTYKTLQNHTKSNKYNINNSYNDSKGNFAVSVAGNYDIYISGTTQYGSYSIWVEKL